MLLIVDFPPPQLIGPEMSRSSNLKCQRGDSGATVRARGDVRRPTYEAEGLSDPSFSSSPSTFTPGSHKQVDILSIFSTHASGAPRHDQTVPDVIHSIDMYGVESVHDGVRDFEEAPRQLLGSEDASIEGVKSQIFGLVDACKSQCTGPPIWR